MSGRVGRWLSGWWARRGRRHGPEEGEKHLPYFELLDALQGPVETCPICADVERRVRARLRSLLYEGVTDPEIRAAFRRARGVCAAHAPLLGEVGDSLGVALLYLDLFAHADLRVVPDRPHGNSWAGCFACAAAREVESRLVAALAAFADDGRVGAHLGRGPGLCWLHVAQAAARMSAAPAAALVGLHAERVRALRQGLQQFASHLDGAAALAGATPAERRALSRAVAFCSSGRGPRPLPHTPGRDVDRR